jgi:cell pole-organizing protein PopZ
MEEILASIRRIISEDGASVEAAPPPSDSVLDLTEMLEGEKPAPPPPPPEPASAVPEVVMEDNIVVPPPAPAASPPPQPQAPPMATLPEDNERLISEMTAQAAAVAMSNLAPRGGPQGDSLPLGNGGRTVESMTMDLLRPLLKDWLDRNLPILVERIVQKEIRKITRDLG